MRKGKSLQQIADEVGASKAHIWQLERGESVRPSIDLVVRLAQYFGVTVASLIGENPDLPGEEEDLIVMYRDLQSLSPEDRDTISMLIDSMRKRHQRKEREGDDQDQPYGTS
ncbi:MAG: helix-turn-helix domain-containing protein [Rhodospirillales bacterium]|nr:helix-turn-helix domain-containing protein [Rhodospirillales bacterium]